MNIILFVIYAMENFCRLHIINRRPDMHIAFLPFPGMTQLDMTGPAQFLSRLPGAKVDYVWKTLDPVLTDAGFAIVPTAIFGNVPSPDIICVPGGVGISDVMNEEEAMDWLRSAGTGAKWVTSVCTGSLILGAAGLLKGYKATTHWAWHHHLARFGAEPVQARTVVDGNRVTGGGVTAGIDFALTLMAELAGEDYAKAVQLGMEYDPAPPFDCGSPTKAGEGLVAAYAAAMAARAPAREAELIAAAERLGFR
jgi:cyclohexyl-isocyanide hydratase